MVRVCLVQSNGRVCGAEPGESQNNVFSSTFHYVEEVLLGDSFDVGIEDAGVVDCTSFVCSLVHVLDCNRGGKFFSGESMFSNELLVNVRDVSTRVY